MGKMKMMAFFKNPIVRNAFIVLTTIVIVASIICVPITKASTQIKVAFRASSMGVTAGTRDIEIPELAPGQGEQATKAKKYTSIFCIDEGRKLSYEEYTSEINVYNNEESNKYFTNYGSALWLFDNMYLANGGNKDIALDYLSELVTSPDVAKNFTSYGNISANDIKSLNKTVGGKKDKYGNTLCRNFIEVVEQLVLWNYTNNTGNVNPDTLVNGGFSGKNITSEDQNKAKYLYHALKYLADKNSNYKSNGSVSNVISLDSSKAAINIKENKVGPYVLKANGVTLNINDEYKSKIHATVTKTDGSTQELNSSKIIEENGKFYIDISGCGQITKSNLKIDDIYTGTKTTVEVLTSGKTQNLVNVRKSASTKPLSDEKTVSYSGKYNVRLIKTKADGSTVITNNPAVFTIKGAVDKEEVKTSMDGILNVAVDQPITSATATDRYTIVEDEAPEGFTKYDGTITLNVKFKLEGTTFLLDKENTKISADGKNGKVTLNFQRENTIEIYVPNTEQKREVPEFDLSLRKYISKVDGKAVEESREPVIDAESKTILDQYKTAAYHHTKKALKVKVGSEVEYTIRIYNEGKIDGYAKEITDYLPAGLSFVKLADESSSVYTTDAKADSKKIVIKYTGHELVKADSIGRILNKDTDCVYQEVKMICKVNDGYTGYITNRAEITNYGYRDNADGSWKEAKAIGDSDRDSVQNTISNALGLDTWYERAKTYTYTDNGITKTIANYYPGVQDDDDFETVEVEKEKIFDLALRKFITNVNGEEITSRIPQVTITDDFKSGKDTDAVYTHPKDPVSVETNDIVTYTIRVYNEGNEDGYASKIMDDIPDGLEFLPDNKINTDNAWKMYAETSNKDAEGAITYNKKVYAPTTDASKADLIVSDYLKDQLIKGYDAKTMNTFDFKDVKVAFKVVEPNSSDRVITNYAQITEHKDSNKDSSVTDRDSTPNEWIDEDDDQDEEKIKLQDKIFDLSLRKFITNIDGKEITSRIPKVTLTDDFKSGKVTTATYEHPKDPLDVVTGNIVTYTIRVYNEGEESGYASKIMDDIPDGLEYIPAEFDKDGKPVNTNAEYRWVAFKELKQGEVAIPDKTIKYNNKNYIETTDVKNADLIVTNYLKDELIKAYDAKTMDTLDYRDVKVAFKVVEPNNSDRIITNYAQITEHKDSNKSTSVTDRDSTPNEWIEKDDDQDIEHIKLQDKDFDLALRKFITNVNGKEITSRIPEVKLTDDFKSGKVTTATYEHPKDPVDVVSGNIVTYTIRVYNEGEVDGYASKVMDDIPEGLEFLPTNETNTEYAWKMYAETSNANVEGAITYNKKVYAPTTDASKADLIITDYLKDQLIKAYDANTMETLDFKDVKVAFKVIEPDTSDRIIVNYAQITEHKDSNGNTVIDRDSTPNEWNDGEDDQDVEKIRLRYFDLSLRKWVTEAIITENGKTQIVETGHKAEDDPEDIVKVDLKKSKLSDVTVKFRYSIRVTNEGELAGYAKEVSDYIPEGLVFDANDNPGWTQKDENTVTTDALANILLNPGESTEVTIVLTWVNSETNMGVKTNTAEISQDYNDYGAEDIDSTPGNKVPDEDDIDIAPVMLSVKTGSAIIGFVTLAVGFLAIIGTGVYTIKRRIV
ncbi:MAG: Cys-Gln thioester bond-forming surface protein [Clostridia bacterium]|nr:Cys-Gln thioester bond-forming surface protein [Clostridia bacterium]